MTLQSCPKLGLDGQDFVLQCVTGYGTAQEWVRHQARQLSAISKGADSWSLCTDSTPSSWCSKSFLEMGSEQHIIGSTADGSQITQIQEVKVSQDL